MPTAARTEEVGRLKAVWGNIAAPPSLPSPGWYQIRSTGRDTGITMGLTGVPIAGSKTTTAELPKLHQDIAGF